MDILGFVGQEGIITQLNKVYIPLMKAGKNFNFLFKAPSGMGKTMLAKLTAVCTEEPLESMVYFLPDDTGSIDYQYLTNKRFIIIDEAHTLKNQEMLYPILDKGNKTFLIASNEFGLLKEPLQNRCINFIYQPYTVDDMINIILLYSEELNYEIKLNFVKELVKCSGTNPRLAKSMLSAIYNYELAGNPKIKTTKQLTETLSNIYGIQDGLNVLQRRYLEFLRGAESASLDLISYVLRVDKMTVRRDIEPILIERNLIGIGARGRYIRDN